MTETAPLPPSAPRAGSLAAWILAARPQTLPVSIAPVVVGTSVALHAGPVHWTAVAAAAWGAVWLQIGANFANDVFDHEKGADTESRLGPPRAAQLGLLSPEQLKGAVGLALALAFLSGLYLTSVGGPVIIGIGIASMLCAVGYTGGPFPLAYNGLGDLAVFIFFGLVAVGGTAWVASGALPALTLPAAVAVGALATAVLVVNNVRDRVSDQECGKRTLIARFGRKFGIKEYSSLIWGAHAMPAVMVLSGKASPIALLGTATLPIGLRLIKRMKQSPDSELNPMLGGTARLMLAQAAAMAAGLVLGKQG